MALLRWVKNSVLKTQLMRGSGSCGELTPRENQSSFSFDVLTYLIAPSGIVRSEDIWSWRLTIAWTTIQTLRFVCSVSALWTIQHVCSMLTSTNIRGLGLLDLPNLVTSNSHLHENSTRSLPIGRSQFRRVSVGKHLDRSTTHLDRVSDQLARAASVADAQIVAQEAPRAY